MKNAAQLEEARLYYSRLAGGVRAPGMQPDFLHVVEAWEIKELQEGIARAGIPADFAFKLDRLSRSGLCHTFIEQNCRRFIELLIAASDGSFKPVDQADRDRVLRVLAYVRKDDDALPDYRADGYLDDQQEVRRTVLELTQLLERFKNWRLRQLVPRLWRPKAVQSSPVDRT